MAVTTHTSGSVTIRGIKYTITNTSGQLFTCYASHNGAATSEGGDSSLALTAGTQYWFSGWATDDDNGGALTAYPYLVYDVPTGKAVGWYKENVFPYATYKITYNANGGSGAPSSQTKIHGTNLTLSSTKPTRTGYTFEGWALSKAEADAGTWYYSAGSTCGKNENLTLYAVWTEHCLTVNYYSNYATSAFSGALNTVGADKNVKVYEYKFYYDNDYSTYGLSNYSNTSGSLYMTRIGYTATGEWGTSTSGGTLVDENATFGTGQAVAEAFGKSLKTSDASINLYAQWKENTLTVNYHSNYATSAFEGAPEVGADKDVVINTYSFGYESSENYSTYGLGNYSNLTGGLYMERTRYDATGYWCTTYAKDIKLEGNKDDVIEYDGGIAIGENYLFDSGQELAQLFGLSLEDGNKSIEVYAHWILLASRVTAYDSDGNPHRGLCHFYDSDGNLHYAIITVYDEDGIAHEVI